MAVEIERKFLVSGDGWRGGPGRRLVQGYLSESGAATVRVRIDDGDAFLTIKGDDPGRSRPEFEYAIPLADAQDLLRLCRRPLIEKTRYEVEHAGLVWEVDVFEGDNAGLVIAEVELDSAGQAVELPPWVGDEVTDDLRYRNSNLPLPSAS